MNVFHSGFGSSSDVLNWKQEGDMECTRLPQLLSVEVTDLSDLIEKRRKVANAHITKLGITDSHSWPQHFAPQTSIERPNRKIVMHSSRIFCLKVFLLAFPKRLATQPQSPPEHKGNDYSCGKFVHKL